MNRTGPWFGAFLLALVTAFLAAFGLTALADPIVLVLCSGLFVGAVLSIASGLASEVPIGPVAVPWHVLLGAAHVTVASAVAVLGLWTAATAGATSSQFLAVAMTVGGASLAWLGLQTARDDRHLEPDRTPSLQRLVGVVLLTVASIGIGVVVAALV
ncbi:hypothetical protein ACFO5R_11385 [Halosolutus amylolyticus]|uniref:Uncharacterized protein n=1 Tax=Halosolutus amylolyticus TaxID=2932267 RepID=A0ABD5PPH7_9EURY|nr:hypothetical protein [Halosolutus amylolyticus]